METEQASSEFSSQEDILTEESGLLYGVGNEVWIGLFGVLIFIWVTKFLLDEYIFPIRIHDIGNGSDELSQGRNQGQWKMRGVEYKNLLGSFPE